MPINDKLSRKSAERREFIADSSSALVPFFRGTPFKVFLTSLAGYLSASCSTFDEKADFENMKPEEFPLEDAIKHYTNMRKGGLYNSTNPNLKWSHSEFHTFKGAFINGWTPGITYNVRRKPITAIAPGRVWSIGDIPYMGPHRLRGKRVIVGHGTGKGKYDSELLPGKTKPSFRSEYGHLNKISHELIKKMKKGQYDVARGETIGYSYAPNKPKLILIIEGSWEDPDNYGPSENYGDEGIRNYMKYSNSPEYDTIELSRREMDDKWEKQNKIVMAIYKTLGITMWDHYHKKTGYGTSIWSAVEEMRFLQYIQSLKKDIFKGINSQEFRKLSRTFWCLQPLYASIPLESR